MHASITPVSVSGLSGSGTATSLHVTKVHETKGKDYGHASVTYDFRDGDTVLGQGVLAVDGADYAAGSVSDGAVVTWLAGKLGFQVIDVVSDPAPARHVDEVQEPEQPGA